jgi:hypothetical protein
MESSKLLMEKNYSKPPKRMRFEGAINDIYIKASVFECFSSGQWRDFFGWIQSNFYYPFLCKCFGRAL